MSSVIKRDGTTVRFDSSKIGSAITKANTRSQEMSPEDIEKIVEMKQALSDFIIDDKINKQALNILKNYIEGL